MKMNKFLMATAVVAVFTAGVLSFTKAYAIDSTLTIDAVVVEAITLDCTTTNLDFGNLDSANAGVVTVSTAGVRTSTEATNLVGGGSEAAGECDMDGNAGLVVDFQIDDTTLANITTPGDTLAIDNYTLAGVGAAAGDGNNFDVTLDGANNTYSIGADLTIVGGEDPGTYQGTTTVTALYQ